MKFLIPLVAVGAAVFFGLKYAEAERAKAEVTQQLEEKTKELEELKAATAGRNGVADAGKPGGARPHLLEEKLRNWKNPLDVPGDKSQRPPGR